MKHYLPGNTTTTHLNTSPAQTITIQTKRDRQCVQRLTFWQRYGDDDAVAGADPQAVTGDEHGRDSHKGETQLACPFTHNTDTTGQH